MKFNFIKSILVNNENVQNHCLSIYPYFVIYRVNDDSNGNLVVLR